MNWTKSCSYNDAQKTRFHREAKIRLKALAFYLGLKKEDFDLRSCKGGIAISGEVILHSDTIYIQVGQLMMGPNSSILIRTCKSRKDYTGGQNHFGPLSDLDNLEVFAARVRAVMARCAA